ncbi:MAG: DUF5723 family protein [bacterium]
MMKFSSGLVLTVTALGLTSSLYSQSGISNARSVAMGSAYTAIARAVESPSWNPANLGLSGNNVYHFNLLSLGFGISNNSFSMKHYDLYNGKYLTVEDKQDILASIPAEGLIFDFGTEVQALGVAFGPLAITASGFAVSDFTLSKDVVDLILNGNEFKRSYNIGDTDGEAWGVSSVGLSLAFPLSRGPSHEFAVGATVKYLHGLAYGKVREATTTIKSDFDGLHTAGRVVIDRALGGNGFSIDAGAATRTGNWTLSAGVANLSNYINWKNDTKRFTYQFQADSVTVESVADTDIDSVFIDSDETVDIDPFTTKLPTELRVGLARTTKRFTFGLDFTKAFRRAPGVSSKPKYSLGTELRPIHFLPLRAGVSFGGNRGFITSAGFALDFSIFSWDFAVASPGGFSSSKGLAFAYNWMFRF